MLDATNNIVLVADIYITLLARGFVGRRATALGPTESTLSHLDMAALKEVFVEEEHPPGAAFLSINSSKVTSDNRAPGSRGRSIPCERSIFESKIAMNQVMTTTAW